jgi:hypothetical protein
MERPRKSATLCQKKSAWVSAAEAGSLRKELTELPNDVSRDGRHKKNALEL